MLPIRRVMKRPEDNDDVLECGICAAASAVGVSYRTMRNTIWPKFVEPKMGRARCWDYFLGKYIYRKQYIPQSQPHLSDSYRDGVDINEIVAGMKRLGCTVKLTNDPGKYMSKHRIVFGMIYYDSAFIAHSFCWCPVNFKFIDSSYDRALQSKIYVAGFKRLGEPAIVVLDNGGRP